jgi:hypothetical protein
MPECCDFYCNSEELHAAVTPTGTDVAIAH